MAGYLVLPEEACAWSANQTGKVQLNPVRFGLIDLVRQFEQNPFPYSRRSQGVCLFGLDQLLVPAAQQSFNVLLLGALVGAAAGLGLHRMLAEGHA